MSKRFVRLNEELVQKKLLDHKKLVHFSNQVRKDLLLGIQQTKLELSNTSIFIASLEELILSCRKLLNEI